MRFNTKELINIGLFSVLYFVTFMIAGMLGYIPIFVVILPLIAGVLGGIPFALFITKEQKFGAVTIMGLLVGLLTFLLGQTWMSILFGLIFGYLADIIMKSGDYKNYGKNIFGYVVFNLWTIGTMLPMWIMRESFFEKSLEMGQSESYMKAVEEITPNYMLVVIIGVAIVGGIIGMLLGKVILKKHFEKAGII